MAWDIRSLKDAQGIITQRMMIILGILIFIQPYSVPPLPQSPRFRHGLKRPFLVVAVDAAATEPLSAFHYTVPVQGIHRMVQKIIQAASQKVSPAQWCQWSCL